jgi:hypothetical protein
MVVSHSFRLSVCLSLSLSQSPISDSSFVLTGVLNPPWKKTCQCRVVGGVRAVAQALTKHAHKVACDPWLSSLAVAVPPDG